MALDRFLLNVRTAAVFFSRDFDFENPQIPADLTGAVRYRDIWLTPRAVEGFDLEDFHHLPPDRRDELAKRVKEFQETAERLTGPTPSDEEVQRAGEQLVAVTRLLNPNLDPRWLAVHKAIREARSRFPAWVVGVFPVTDYDWTGDPIVRVYVTVEDSALQPDRHLAVRREVEKIVEEAFRASGIGDRLSLGLVAKSEMGEVIGADVS